MPQVTQLGAIPSRTVYTRKYDSFRGVDFSVDMTQIDPSRSPDAPNLLSDSGGCPEKRVGWRTLVALPDRINGIFRFGGKYAVHAGEKIYSWNGGEDAPVEAYSGVRDGKSFARRFDEYMIILTGAEMLLFDGETVSSPTDKAYIPTTSIGRQPGDTPGGTAHQQINLLVSRRKNAFSVPDDTSLVNLYGERGASSGDVYLRFIDRPGDYIFKWGVGETEGERGTDYDNRRLDPLSKATLWRSDGGRCRVMLELYGRDRTYPYIEGVDNMVIEYGTTPPIRRKTKKEPFTLVNNTSTQTISLTTPAITSTYVFVRFKDRADTWLLSQYAGGTTMRLGYNYQGNPVNSSTTGTITQDGEGMVQLSIKLHSADDDFPYTPGEANIIVEYEYALPPQSDDIHKCTFCETFQNRVFFSGNPGFPNMDWHSGVDDPLYVPDLSYTEIGESDAIAGYLKVGGSLAIIKEDGGQGATVFLRSAQFDASGEMVFPVAQGVPGVGGVSPRAMLNFLDDPVFLSESGVYAIGSNDVTAERALHIRSSRVNNRLTREPDLADAAMVAWDGYLLVCVNGNVYVADVRQKSYARNRTETFEYEWYFWNNVPARCLLANGDTLYFGTNDGRLCRFNNDLFDANGKIDMSAYNDDGAPIVAQWATKLDDDGDFMAYKTMIKKGSGVSLKAYTRSGVKILLRTERDFGVEILTANAGMFTFDDVDFEHFTFNTSPYSMTPFNAKIKKYKAIQVICRNETINQGFGIYSIIRRYVTGNFVK